MEPATNLLGVLVWSVIVLIGLFTFRKPIRSLMDRVTNFSVAGLSLKASALQDVRDSLIAGFSEQDIRRSEVESLIESRVRFYQAAIERKVTGVDVRNGQRNVDHRDITIEDTQGERFSGKMIDTSQTGFGFQSMGQFNYHDLVLIPMETERSENFGLIVRVQRESNGGYRYGATKSHRPPVHAKEKLTREDKSVHESPPSSPSQVS